MEPNQSFGDLNLNRNGMTFTTCMEIRLAGSVSKALESLQQILNS